MRGFGEWLSSVDATPATSFEAHFRLVAIHPFSDDSGHAPDAC